MVKHGAGRHKNTVSCDDAEFFKVFLPQICSHQLKIPSDFVKHFDRTLKEKVTLKDVGGKVWHVDVERTGDGVFLKKGWQSFVSYHNLMVGEFLVFKHDGKNSFIVKLYGINGCKKELFVAKQVKFEEDAEEETEAKRTLCNHAYPHQEDHLLGGKKQRDIPLLGSKETTENVASKLPESCKYPYFVSHLSNHSRQVRVTIPKEVLSADNLRLKPNMILRNADGKEWDVRILNAKDGRVYIARGWSKFWKDNNLGLEDSCRFTFTTERLSKIIRVRILRAKETKH